MMRLFDSFHTFKYADERQCGRIVIKQLNGGQVDMHVIILILLIIGIIALIASFFVGRSSKGLEEEIEQVSISLHQEVSNIKRRLKAVEEELMVGIVPPVQRSTTAPKKPVHQIIVSQILALHSQGFSLAEIAKRASLSTDEVADVLRSKGVNRV